LASVNQFSHTGGSEAYPVHSMVFANSSGCYFYSDVIRNQLTHSETAKWIDGSSLIFFFV